VPDHLVRAVGRGRRGPSSRPLPVVGEVVAVTERLLSGAVNRALKGGDPWASLVEAATADLGRTSSLVTDMAGKVVFTPLKPGAEEDVAALCLSDAPSSSVVSGLAGSATSRARQKSFGPLRQCCRR
jgi:hypothetical protein